MSVQTTLFGTVVQENEGRIYDSPVTQYEQFIERYYGRHKGKGKPKATVICDGQKEWSKMKHDSEALKKFLQAQPGEKEFGAHIPDRESVQVRNYGIVRETKPREELMQDVMIVDDPSVQGSSTPSSASQFQEVRSKMTSGTKTTVLFNCLCPELAAEFLTDDVVNNKSFSQCVASTQSAILYFLKLRDQYRVQKRRQRRSRLRRELEAMDSKIQELVNLIAKACKVVISPSLGLDVLTQSSAQKQSLLLQIGQSLMALKKDMSKKRVVNDLRRRISQQQQRASDDQIHVQCHNSADFTWKNAYDAIDNLENAGAAGNEFPLNFGQLRQAGALVEASLSLPISVVQETFGVPTAAVDLALQLLDFFPVLLLTREKQGILVNVPEVIMTPDVFEKLLTYDYSVQAQQNTPTESHSDDITSTFGTSKSTGGKVGRPSLVSKFPGIIKCMTEFIKQHGFSAHSRRREETGMVGVSLGSIRDHLMQNIPGLKEHGLSKHTVARLMDPPRRGTTAGKRYQGLVKARVPGKRNSYREDNPDQHYLFARVAYRREFSEMFSNECAIFSCDDMNKVKVGALAVSRYHQIERFYPAEDVPNVPDHDFPVPGYLLIPSGYMRLLQKDSVSVSSENDPEVMEYQEHSLNDSCRGGDDESLLSSDLTVETQSDALQNTCESAIATVVLTVTCAVSTQATLAPANHEPVLTMATVNGLSVSTTVNVNGGLLATTASGRTASATASATVTGGPVSATASGGGGPVSAFATGGPVSASANGGGGPVSASATGGPVSASANGGGGPVSASATGGPISASANGGGGPVSASATGGPVSASANGGGGPVSASANGGARPVSASATGGPVSASANGGGGPVSASATGGPVSASATAGPVSASATGGPVSASVTSGPLSVIPNKESMKTDSLQREHLKTPHTGPAAICVRAAKFHSSTSETHCHDLKPMIDEVVKEGRTVVTVIADGGPDWSTNSLLNALFFLRLWKDCNLDLLCICSYAARYSAYNPIEHLWAPMSKRLTSVMFSAVAKGDTKPPCYLSGLSAEEKKKKEAEVFDRALSELCSVHWKGAEFDTFEIHSIPIPSQDCSPSEHDLVHKFLKAPVSKLSEYSSLYEELKFMVTHMQRHRNELVYLKCLNEKCDYCMTHPPKATGVFAFLQERNMTLFSPMPSHKHPGHYCTFLEMCSKPASELSALDAGMPSSANGVGSCPQCPAFVFLSKTEKKRHLRVLHPNQRKARKDQRVSGKSYLCNFKLDSGKACGKGFSTIYQLRLHRKTVKHQKKRISTQKTRAKSKTGQSYAARLIRSFSEVQHLSSSESDESEKDTEAAAQAETLESDEDLQMGQEMDTEAAAQTETLESDEDLQMGQETNTEAAAQTETRESDEDLQMGQETDTAAAAQAKTRESDEMDTDGAQTDPEDTEEVCIICGFGENDDEEEDLWVECVHCLNWTHVRCLPEGYPFHYTDPDFSCPICRRLKRRRL